MLSVALGFGVLAWAGPAAAAKAITVATTTDTAPGTTSGSCSLRMAVERASGSVASNSCQVTGTGNWVVYVPASATAYSLTASNGPLRILRTMTVRGTTTNNSSTKIQGSTAGGVFVVEYGLGISLTFDLKYLRITGSQDEDVDGAALNVREPTAGKTYTVNVDTVQMDNCRAWMGGAVRNAGGNLTISNSYLHDNKASRGGEHLDAIQQHRRAHHQEQLATVEPRRIERWNRVRRRDLRFVAGLDPTEHHRRQRRSE